MVWSNAQPREIACFLLRLRLDPWNGPKTCSPYLFHPPSSSAPCSWPPGPFSQVLCHQDSETSTDTQDNLDLHAPSICQHPHGPDGDAVTLNFVKYFLHRPQKERRHAETRMQAHNHRRGQIFFWQLEERAEGGDVCISLGERT